MTTSEPTTVSSPAELPELVSEFVDLSKDYLRQETLEPAKQLGRLAGFSVAAAVSFAVAVVFLSLAALRFLIDVLPEGANWEALGYVITAVGAASVAVLIAAGAGGVGRRKR